MGPYPSREQKELEAREQKEREAKEEQEREAKEQKKRADRLQNEKEGLDYQLRAEQQRRKRDEQQRLDREDQQRRELRDRWCKEPWRPFPTWDEKGKQELMDYIQSYQIIHDCEEGVISHSNILILGDVGSGKSSFCNTLNSSLIGSIPPRLYTAPNKEGGKTNTLKLAQMEFQASEKHENLKFRLYDCRGLAKQGSLLLQDLEAVLDGHVMENYEFSPENPIDEKSPWYKKSPSLSDKIHCVLFCVSASSVPGAISKEIKELVGEAVKRIKAREIKYLLILNKADELEEDLVHRIEKVFISKAVKSRLEAMAEVFDLSSNFVHPMSNYVHTHEIEVNTAKDVLVLGTFKHVLKAVDTFFQNLKIPKLLKESWSDGCSFDKETLMEQLYKNCESLEFDEVANREAKAPKVVLFGEDSVRYINVVYSALHGKFPTVPIRLKNTEGKMISECRVLKLPTKKTLPFQFCVYTGDYEHTSSVNFQDLIKIRTKDSSEEKGNEASVSTGQSGHYKCAVYLIPAGMTIDDIKKKYEFFMNILNEKGIPQIILLTAMDYLRNSIAVDPAYIFKSTEVKNHIDMLLGNLDHVNIVLPVMLYTVTTKDGGKRECLCLQSLLGISDAVEEYEEME